LVTCSDVVISDITVDNVEECIGVLVDDVIVTVVVICIVDGCSEEFSVELKILFNVVRATVVGSVDVVISIVLGTFSSTVLKMLLAVEEMN
jgi:hypothetical protein